MKKIILYNPHVATNFSGTVCERIFRKVQSPGGKYFYIIKNLLKKQGRILVYLSRKASSFPFPLKYLIPSRLEFHLWCKLNKIDPKKIKIINERKLKRLDDNFVLWGILRHIVDADINILKRTKAITCFNMSHFALGFSKRKSEIVKKINPTHLVAESNLFKNSAFFRKYFPSYKKDVLVMSFVPQERFKVKKSFSERKNKAIATGTFIEFPKSRMDEQFYEFYGINTYQPIRGKIYYGKDSLSAYMDSNMHRQSEEEKLGKEEKIKRMAKLFKRLYKLFFVKTKKKYLSFDIVKLYNDYKMAVIGEETELPGIGSVECMACGCAYIGQNLPFYKDLGMIPGKHFIAYNGTMEDLKKKISYYQKHPKELEKIAKAGTKFVKEKCNSEQVMEKFLKDVEKEN